MTLALRKKKKIFLFAIAFSAFALLFFSRKIPFLPHDVGIRPDAGGIPEARHLQGKNLSFPELALYFQSIARAKGAEYAYRALASAPLPPDTDLHLLGHAIGEVLYAQKGIRGIELCTEEFRNACSHSIVAGLLLERGESALSEIADACRRAPGGSGAYTMCYHGLGHGILAYADYDFKKAAALCAKTGTAEYGFEEGSQCVGGAVMEIISGGGHNHALWEQERPKWLKTGDPLSLCKKDFVPDAAKTFCYLYITPYLWEAAGGNAATNDPAIFEKAFRFCAALPESAAGAREPCFGGFGKEFITIAQDRDIRAITQMNEAQFERVYSWCALARDRGGVAQCLANAVYSLYWGGENAPDAAVRFCKGVSDSSFQGSCMTALINSVFAYQKDSAYRKSFCAEIPGPYQKECADRLTR